MTKAEAGNIGEEAVREVLRSLKGNLISGFIRSNNLQCNKQNFQVDFLVFIPSIGLVLIEVKNWKGTIKATSDTKWIQEIEAQNKIYKNQFPSPSSQVLRTSGLLMQMLEKEQINKWPIRPLVIFANDNAKILKAINAHSPQTDIILKSMIPSWIKNNSTDEVKYKFHKSEFNRVKSIIQKYTSEYEAPSR
jgi:hypothetical protein